jgi:hypothetical protein
MESEEEWNEWIAMGENETPISQVDQTTITDVSVTWTILGALCVRERGDLQEDQENE